MGPQYSHIFHQFADERRNHPIFGTFHVFLDTQTPLPWLAQRRDPGEFYLLRPACGGHELFHMNNVPIRGPRTHICVGYIPSMVTALSPHVKSLLQSYICPPKYHKISSHILKRIVDSIALGRRSVTQPKVVSLCRRYIIQGWYRGVLRHRC